MSEKQVILMVCEDMTPLDLKKFQVALDNVFPNTAFIVTNTKIETMNVGQFYEMADWLNDIALRIRGETLTEKIVRKVKEYAGRI